MFEEQDASELRADHRIQNIPRTVDTAHRGNIGMAPSAVEFGEQGVLAEARVVRDVVEADGYLDLLLAPVLAAQLYHAELSLDDFIQAFQCVRVQVVKEKLLPHVHGVAAVD